MSIDYEHLRVLHHKLRLQTEFQSQINRAPIKIRLAKENEKKFEQESAEAKARLTKAKMAADEKQLQLGEREAKIENLKNNRNAAASNKEYQLLNDQIAADEQANSVLSDEILELLEKIDQLDLEHQTAKDNLAKSCAEAKSTTEKIEKELVILRAKLAEVQETITGLESKLPLDMKVEYYRLVKAVADDALALSDLETCGNCNQRLTPQVKSNLTMQKTVFCSGCGSVMYIASRSPAGS